MHDRNPIRHVDEALCQEFSSFRLPLRKRETLQSKFTNIMQDETCQVKIESHMPPLLPIEPCLCSLHSQADAGQVDIDALLQGPGKKALAWQVHDIFLRFRAANSGKD